MTSSGAPCSTRSTSISRGRRVLDAGCNRGGFLRLLADERGIAEGFGYDPAAGAIEDARRLAGDRPLRFEASSSVPDAWSGLDVAFSHEMLYLLPDLAPHAAAIHRALRPGGVYFAVMGVHTGSPSMVEWHAANQEELRLPPLYDVDDVIATFQRAGFDAVGVTAGDPLRADQGPRTPARGPAPRLRSPTTTTRS